MTSSSSLPVSATVSLPLSLPQPDPGPPPLLALAGQVTLGTGTASLEVWSGTGSAVRCSQDEWLAEPYGAGIRLGVFDGVTPWQGVAPAGMDPAVWAAGIARAAARSAESPGAGLRAAHAALWRPELAPSRRRPSVAAAVADVVAAPLGLTVRAASAADCEVWARGAQGWIRLLGGDALEPTWRRAWQAELDAHPHWDEAARLEAEAVFLDDPACWRHPALGRHASLTPQHSTAGMVESVVLASDGARLDADALERLGEHLAGVMSESHGDLTVLRLTLTDPAPADTAVHGVSLGVC